MTDVYDVVILGAGASGLMAASSALSNGKKVAVLEHNSQPLAKVKISGGGNCNFTNLSANVDHYLSSNPHFCISALKQFSATDMLDLAAVHRLRSYQKTPGQYFCTDGSAAMMKLLLAEAQGAKIFYNTVFKNITPQNTGFKITTNQETFHCHSLIIACGGASYANLGATTDGFQLAKALGHKIIPTRPALVPLNLDSKLMAELKPLQGVALPVGITVGNRHFQDDLLFTHFGLSGPAILQASLYWAKNQPLIIDLLPAINLFNYLKEQQNLSKTKISTLLKKLLPARLAENLTEQQDSWLAETSTAKLQELAARINQWQIVPVGTQSYRLAEVTAGGVDVNQVSSSTLCSKLVPHLYFCGEVLDVTGQLGGYNLQWAFSSGFVAGKNAG